MDHRGVSRTNVDASVDERVRFLRAKLAEQLERLMSDAGVSQRTLAAASGVPRSFLARILAGEATPAPRTYARLGAVLGADFSMRYFPNTGPTIHDRHQAPMLEHLLDIRHPRWDAFTEVAVRRPSRGWIDLALHEPRERVLLASELQSELRRLEQLIRWHAAKADSLTSWSGFAHLGDDPRIGRLLIVRRTRATRGIASEYGRQLRVAYPAHPDDAVAALTGTTPWPGDALVWMVLDAGRTRLATGR
jgi:transcriptional regulator with XRE-family HTH domain